MGRNLYCPEEYSPGQRFRQSMCAYSLAVLPMAVRHDKKRAARARRGRIELAVVALCPAVVCEVRRQARAAGMCDRGTIDVRCGRAVGTVAGPTTAGAHHCS